MDWQAPVAAGHGGASAADDAPVEESDRNMCAESLARPGERVPTAEISGRQGLQAVARRELGWIMEGMAGVRMVSGRRASRARARERRRCTREESNDCSSEFRSFGGRS